MNRCCSFLMSVALFVMPVLLGCDAPTRVSDSADEPGASSLPPGTTSGIQSNGGQADSSSDEATGVEAQVGVGKKGDYGPGLITTPASAYWKTKEKIVFEIQIPEAMKLYKALNGAAPSSHEAFMKEIVEAGGISLPELPEGQIYRYEPSTEMLMVVPAE